MKPTIVIIDDDQDICLLLDRLLSKKGYGVKTASDGDSGMQLLKQAKPDLVVCDFKLPDYSGIDMLRKVKVLYPEVPVIIITGYSDVKVAVDALKKGAYDYVTKPLYPDEVLMLVEEAMAKPQKKKDIKKPIKQKVFEHETTFVKGKSPQSELVWKHVDLIAPTDMSVIIEGETGTGKEYVARAIHAESDRKGKAFVAVDCGALSEELAGSELFGHVKGAFTGALRDKKGCFEQAHGGTLFLDEIGNLSYENQMKLLRALQERKVRPIGGEKVIQVDVRVIVATNESLHTKSNAGDFREDLYHRLNEFKIELAPLRERQGDIATYANHFLEQANHQLSKEVKGFTKDVIQKMKYFKWEGNLRELRNVIKRAVLLCKGAEIDETCLPAEISNIDDAIGQIETENLTLKQAVRQAESRVILQALKRSGNNKSKAAKLLGVDRKTLYNKLTEYNLNV